MQAAGWGQELQAAQRSFWEGGLEGHPSRLGPEASEWRLGRFIAPSGEPELLTDAKRLPRQPILTAVSGRGSSLPAFAFLFLARQGWT